MQTSSGTGYFLELTCGQNDGGSLSFNSQSGATDEFVLAVAEALRGVAYPASEDPVTVSVSKVSNTATVTYADWTTEPPAFT